MFEATPQYNVKNHLVFYFNLTYMGWKHYAQHLVKYFLVLEPNQSGYLFEKEKKKRLDLVILETYRLLSIS